MSRSIAEGFFKSTDAEKGAIPIAKANEILQRWLATHQQIEGGFLDFENGQPEFQQTGKGATHVGYFVEVRDKT